MAATLELCRADFDRPGLNALVRRACAGDGDAAVEAVDRCRPMVERIARSRGLDGHTTEDMLQDLRIMTTHKVAMLTDPDALTGWLRTAAYRWRADRRRRVERTFDPQEPCGPMADLPSTDDPTATVHRREVATLVVGAVNLLPPLHREPIRLFFFESLSVQEIARKLGVPEGTIKSRLHHGRQRLANLLPARLAA